MQPHPPTRATKKMCGLETDRSVQAVAVVTSSSSRTVWAGWFDVLAAVECAAPSTAMMAV